MRSTRNPRKKHYEASTAQKESEEKVPPPLLAFNLFKMEQENKSEIKKSWCNIL